MSEVEEWRSINNHLDYEASNLGRIRSKKKWRGTHGRILKMHFNSEGYLTVCLDRKTKRVHKLVSSAFLDIPDSKIVNHKNGIKSDNRADNLEYCNHSENLKHAYRLNLRGRNGPRGELAGKAILRNEDVLAIAKSKESGVLLAQRFGVTPSTICLIRKGKCWGHITGIAREALKGEA